MTTHATWLPISILSDLMALISFEEYKTVACLTQWCKVLLKKPQGSERL